MIVTNITVVGASEEDMATAVNRLIEIEGGFAVAEGGRVLAELALPVAGLMSLLSFEQVREALIPCARRRRALASFSPSRSCKSPSCRCR